MLVCALVVFGCLLFLVLYKSKVCLKSTNTDYLSKPNSDSVKALAALGVMFHHISNEIACGVCFYPFQIIGFLMVAIFFFYSGYGLIYSINSKKNYATSFWAKRMPAILVPYSLALIVHEAVYSFLFEFDFNFTLIVTQFLGDTPVVRYSWFVIVLTYLYFVFWICFVLIKSKAWSWIIFILTVLAWSAVPVMPHSAPTIILFLIGAVVAKFKDYLDKYILRHSWSLLATSSALFAILMIIRAKSDDILEPVLTAGSAISFVMFVLLLLTKFNVDNIFLRFINSISFEIYLYHGLVMLILNRIEAVYHVPEIYISLVVVFTIITAYVASLARKLVTKKLFRRSIAPQ